MHATGLVLSQCSVILPKRRIFIFNSNIVVILKKSLAGFQKSTKEQDNQPKLTAHNFTLPAVEFVLR